MRRRLPAIAAAGALAVAAAAALVAYVVVPAFVHRELHEPAPAAAATPAPSAPASAPAPAPSPSGPSTLLSGDLRRLSAVDYGTGRVLVLDTGGGRVLRFEDVDIAGAPNMYVYLSDRSDGQPGRFLDLGRLKATTGSFNYDLPPGTDLGAVRSVVVWCRQFSTTITFALLA